MQDTYIALKVDNVISVCYIMYSLILTFSEIHCRDCMVYVSTVCERIKGTTRAINSILPTTVLHFPAVEHFHIHTHYFVPLLSDVCVLQQLNQVQLLQAKITAITSQLQLKTGPTPNATPTTQPHGIIVSN